MMIEVIIAFALIFLYVSMFVSFIGVLLWNGNARKLYIKAVLLCVAGIVLIVLQIPKWLGV